MSSDETQYAELWLGNEVEKFLETDVGRYLRGRSENEYLELQAKIADIDPHSFTTLVDLQNAIDKARFDLQVNRKIMSYFSDAVINGRNAYAILAEREQ